MFTFAARVINCNLNINQNFKKMNKTSFLMKKIYLAMGCVAFLMLLSSCYSSTVSMGDMKPTDPAVHVATAHEAHFIAGLVGSTKRDAKNYVGDNKDYRIKQYQSFVDGLLGTITVGIYTPTTTKFFLPYGATAAPVKKEKGLPVKFGVRAGLNISSASFKNDVDGLSSRIGFHGGFIMDIPVSKSFYIQSGVYYTQKGFKYEATSMYGGSNDTKTVTSTQGYVEVPILASYRYPLMDDLQLQIHAGPYFAARISNKVDDDQYSYYGHGSSGSFDAGIQAGAGVLYANHYYAGIGYEWGFVEQEKTKSKNRNFFISIGYNF